MRTVASYTDNELIDVLSCSDLEAFDELYNRYWESLYSRAWGFLRDEDAAKDCVQEVFVWLWLNRGALQVSNVNHYLHQAARFQALRIIREKQKQIRLDERLYQLTHDLLQEKDPAGYELKEIICKVIARLPKDQQEIFLMSREEGLTYNQIAAVRNISVKTVEKKMSLALKWIRPALKKAFSLCLLFGLIR